MTRAPRWARRSAGVALVVVALVVVTRLLLDPLAAAATRRGLSKMEGLRGEFDRVHVTLFSPGYTITRLRVIEHPDGDWRAPVFFAEAVHVAIDWRRLLHGQLVARARLVEPKVIVVAGARPRDDSGKRRAPDLSAELPKIAPLKIDRVEIVRGEFLFRDLSQPRHPELWVHGLELAAENLATRERLANARPTTISAKGLLGRSGDLGLFVAADPFASPLAFAGRFELRGLRAAELYAFIEPETKLQTPKGTVDLFAEFKVKGGLRLGGVKPVLRNVEVQPAEPGAWDRLKAWLAQAGMRLASDRVPERNAVVTVVPLEGRLVSPDVQLWPAVLGVVRNAFVEGIASGFAHLPPAQAPHKEGVLAQGKDALTKDKGPPKAQPSAPTPRTRAQ